MMLTEFPIDIVRVILEEYVAADVMVLSHLDIAYCSHRMRNDACSLLTLIRVREEEEDMNLQPVQASLNFI